MSTTANLSAQLDRIAAVDSNGFPILSLYLNLQPDQHGRDSFEPFLRKELADRVRTYPAEGPERESLERDAARIREYMAGIDKAANGLAVFACSGIDFFEAIPLKAPIGEHRLFVSDQPHLYPLARVIDGHPRYAVVVADTHRARIFLVALDGIERSQRIEGEKTKGHKMGGWSQARYQRHIENYHLQHAKEVVDALTRLVRAEDIAAIVMAGDEVVVPLLREQLPKDIAAKVVDVVKLDIRAPEHEVLAVAAERIRDQDARTDREVVDSLIGAYRANALAVVGVDETRRALDTGQVDELVIAARPDAVQIAGDEDEPSAALAAAGTPSPQEHVVGELVLKAHQTAARIRFIEEADLLASAGGVGAFLRFRL